MSRGTSKSDYAAGRELDRIAAFSDGVFAVAITLLVLNIEVPDKGDGSLGSALDNLLPDIYTYFIAFGVIGLFWYGHHVAWARFRRSNGRLVWTNMLLLSLIALMPFTTALVGNYDEPLSIAVYAFNIGLAAIADSLIDRVGIRGDLMEPLDDDVKAEMVVAGTIRPLVFFASIPLAWVDPLLAQLSWLTLIFVPAIAAWLVRRRSGPTAQS